MTIAEKDQDRQLAVKLRTELPGILNWSLVGLDRLRKQDGFTASAMCKEAQADYRLESNPTRVFLTQHCVVDAGGSIRCGQLYDHYRVWSQTSGFKALDVNQFGKELKKALPDVNRRRDSVKDDRAWTYFGLTYTPEAALDEEEKAFFATFGK